MAAAAEATTVTASSMPASVYLSGDEKKLKRISRNNTLTFCSVPRQEKCCMIRKNNSRRRQLYNMYECTHRARVRVQVSDDFDLFNETAFSLTSSFK